MQKNLKSFFYPIKTIDEKSPKSNGNTFLKVAEVSIIVFVIGNLLGILIYNAIHQIKKRPSKNLNFNLPKLIFKSKTNEVELLDD